MGVELVNAPQYRTTDGSLFPIQSHAIRHDEQYQTTVKEVEALLKKDTDSASAYAAATLIWSNRFQLRSILERIT